MSTQIKIAAMIVFLALAACGIVLAQCLELGRVAELMQSNRDIHALASGFEVFQTRFSVLLLAQAVAVLGLIVMAAMGQVQRLRLIGNLRERMSRLSPQQAPIADIVEPAVLLDRLQNALSSEVIDLKRSQKLLIEKAVDVICTVDMDVNFVSVSPSCEQAWGYTAAELKGRPLMSLLESGEAESVLETIVGAADSIDRVVFESQLRRKDGELLDVVWTGHWSASECGLFCIVHDMTRQKLIEKTIRESEHQLRLALQSQQELERMKQEFTAMVTHDLRSPLTAVKGLVLLLQRGEFGSINDQGQRLSSRIARECDRLLRLLNDMLEVDKLQSGSFELKRSSFDLQNTIQEAVENVRDMAIEKHVDVQVDTRAMLCMADEQRITQVLLNLLSNAIKYAPENSPVRISLSESGDMALVAVEDQGRGIPQERLASIFEKFAQVDATDSVDRRGTGLGLAIAKGIVDEHGGSIGVDSKVGQGSKFWFTVPR